MLHGNDDSSIARKLLTDWSLRIYSRIIIVLSA